MRTKMYLAGIVVALLVLASLMLLGNFSRTLARGGMLSVSAQPPTPTPTPFPGGGPMGPGGMMGPGGIMGPPGQSGLVGWGEWAL